MDTYRIKGQVKDRKLDFGIPGLRIEAWDKDLIFDDFLGKDVTGSVGTFEISFTQTAFRELFLDRKPDLYFKIFRGDELIDDTRHHVLWNIATQEVPVTITVDASAAEVEQHENQQENTAETVKYLCTTLTSLTGHILTESKDDRKKLAALREKIAAALVSQEPGTFTSQEFVFEHSDLYNSANLPAGSASEIDQVVANATGEKVVSRNLVYHRTMPVRTVQIPGSTPAAAAGAKVQTEGPFRDAFGRQNYFDFVNIEELIPLYITGWAFPAILFKASFAKPSIILSNAPPVELTRNFTVVPTSVWVNAKIFDPASPAGYFCGLRVKKGAITLDADPQVTGGKLVVTAATKVICDLDLDMKDPGPVDETSPYGTDARNSTVKPPQQFSFSFAGNTRHILSVAPSSWKVFGNKTNFHYQNSQACAFIGFINQLVIPVTCDNPDFTSVTTSPFCHINGKTGIKNSWWALPAAKISVAKPPEAEGNGALLVLCEPGLSAAHVNAENKEITLTSPFIMAEPGLIALADLQSDGSGARQVVNLWQDELNRFGTTMEWRFRKNAPYTFFTAAAGTEMVAGFTNCNMKIDRPVKVDGNAVPVDSKNSLFVLLAGKTHHSLVLFDNNLLWDHKLPAEKIPVVSPIALALHNALFTVTPPNGLLLFGECSGDFTALTSASLFLAFGLFSYLPTLPDPYAANLGIMNLQFPPRKGTEETPLRKRTIAMWLLGLVKWEKRAEEPDKVGVSFHFALLPPAVVGTLQHHSASLQQNNVSQPPQDGGDTIFTEWQKQSETHLPPAGQPVAYSKSIYNDPSAGTDTFASPEVFSLLDVSSKANQMGVSMIFLTRSQVDLVDRVTGTHLMADANSDMFPLRVDGLDVKARGFFAQSFTVPQIAWEPVLNMTSPECVQGAMIPDFKNPKLLVPAKPPFDPPAGFNYYQNDGVATRIGNLSSDPVALSPIPLAKYLVQMYKDQKDQKTYAWFNLPFGMLAMTVLDSSKTGEYRPTIEEIKPVFKNYMIGGIQLELTAGKSTNTGEDSLFEGFTIQLHNINNADGSKANATTLAHDPHVIFNGEFFPKSTPMPNGRPAVPLKRIGLSGYGASSFSDWHNGDALFAQTSQAMFNVVTGRTAHEVVQVKSMVYPWGNRVMRTITLSRLGNGYVVRIDSGWKSEGDAKFDFSYHVEATDPGGKDVTVNRANPFTFHPGIVHGLFNIRNIHDIGKAYQTDTSVNYGPWHVDAAGNLTSSKADYYPETANLQAVRFDCDVKLENVVEGGSANMVVSRGVIGYIQLAPPAAPIDTDAFKNLLAFENNSIGGEICCIIKVAGTDQRMRVTRFDVNNAVDETGKPIFVCAARGSVIMPKEGSWSMVQHNRGTGEVSPLPESLGIPLIRAGQWDKDHIVPLTAMSSLLRFAYPGDLLKTPDDSTINFGFLHNMNTQKVLFLTPSFLPGTPSLLSKTPPLLADAYRLMNTSSIFPSVGNAETTFGTAVSLLKGFDGAGNAVAGAFSHALDPFSNPVTDAGKQVLQILDISAVEDGAGKLLGQGYELIAKKADALFKFELPDISYPLIDITGLKIYIEYKATHKDPDLSENTFGGKFDYNIDSKAAVLADTWKGRANNLAMVVDLGPLKRIMTIKGNFNSQKGQETDFGSKSASDPGASSLPVPEIEFSKDLEPVIYILEFLGRLSVDPKNAYTDLVKRGLKIAMSNSANLWEYKFEASKEFPLIKFPPGIEYNDPLTPLKLEASMSLGVFFNAALKVTSDPKQLLPTAGASFRFDGGLSVMCASLAAVSVYAVGKTELNLRADTSPMVSLDMKFGFGAQVAVGLPVVGNVSVLYMIGIEIYVDTNQKVIVSAFMLYRGQAELLGGLVGVTITIEAKGSIEKEGPDKPTNCRAAVTFAIDISIFLVIDISFSETWEETRQIA